MTETRSRRRGDALLQAIYRAVFGELGSVGYGRLTVEGIAARAGTSKSTIYRRWATVDDLVIDAVHHGLPDGGVRPDTGNVRDDLYQLMRRLATALAGPMGGPIRAVVGEMHRNPRLAQALRIQVFEPRGRELRQVLAEGVRRGEIRAETLNSDIADLGHELVMFRFLTDGEVPDEVVGEIVDNVVMPLLRPQVRYEREIAELKAALADAHLQLRRRAPDNHQ